MFRVYNLVLWCVIKCNLSNQIKQQFFIIQVYILVNTLIFNITASLATSFKSLVLTMMFYNFQSGLCFVHISRQFVFVVVFSSFLAKCVDYKKLFASDHKVSIPEAIKGQCMQRFVLLKVAPLFPIN